MSTIYLDGFPRALLYLIRSAFKMEKAKDTVGNYLTVNTRMSSH